MIEGPLQGTYSTVTIPNHSVTAATGAEVKPITPDYRLYSMSAQLVVGAGVRGALPLFYDLNF